MRQSLIVAVLVLAVVADGANAQIARSHTHHRHGSQPHCIRQRHINLAARGRNRHARIRAIRVCLPKGNKVVHAPKTQLGGGYPNARIAEVGLSRLGQYGGECKEAVNVWVAIASGGTQRLGGDYLQNYRAQGGQEVSRDQAVEGDVIQLNGPDGRYYYEGMHTAVVVSHASGSNSFVVVDSNWNWQKKVSKHEWNPYNTASAHGLSVHIWRMGAAGIAPGETTTGVGGEKPGPGVRSTQTPAVVARNPNSMDVFFTSTGGQLVNEFWGANTGWNQQILAANVAGSPAVVARYETSMDVFYRSATGQLVNEFWSANTGWNQQVLASGVASDPAVVSRNPNSMDVFYENASGQLVNEFWGANTGWNQQILAANVAGSPAVVARYETSMDVFYRSTAGQLINEFWGANTGWSQQTLATGMVSSAAVVARSPTSMDVFYQGSGGQLVNEFWGANTGWNQQILAANVAGSPAVVARYETSMDVFYRSTTGQLVNEFWGANTGWSQQTLATGMTSDAAVVARTPTNMDVFYAGTSGQLVNEFWGANTGWNQQALP